MDEHAAKIVLRNCGWLKDEERWLQDAVLTNSRMRRYDPHEFTFHADDDPGGMFGIVDGGFGVYIASGEGDVGICHVLRRGIWFGHGPVLTKRPRSMSFRAVEPSNVLYLPLSALTAIAADRPEFMRRLSALSEWNYSTVALQVIADLMITSGDRRLAATLIRISRRSSGDEDAKPWPIRVSQSEIGTMANASRDRVNRALARFQRQGWIDVGFKCIEITNPDELARFVAEREEERISRPNRSA